MFDLQSKPYREVAETIGRFRTDSGPAVPSSNRALDYGREALRHVVRQNVAYLAAQGHQVPPERVDALLSALGERLGYRLGDGVWANADYRNDASSLFADELTNRDGTIRMPKAQRYTLSEVLPMRTVDPAQRKYSTRYGSFSGSLKEYEAGSNVAGSFGYQVGEIEHRLAGYAATNTTHWLTALRGTLSDVDDAAMQAEAGRRVYAKMREERLVGTLDLDSNLGNIPGVLRLSKDFSSATTLDNLWVLIHEIVAAAMEASGETGAGINTAIVGPRLARIFTAKSNFDVGGDMTGADLMRKVAVMFADYGITQWAVAPSLKGFGGAGNDGAIFARLDGENGLHQVVGMPFGPVNSATGVHGTRTLWYGSTGGLDINDSTDTVIVTAQVV